MNAEYERTRRCAEHYRSLGLCPLPSRMDRKGPTLPTYAEHYQGVPVPEGVYRNWKTTNCQVITGTKSPTMTKVIAVDIDSDQARDVWWRICAKHGYVPGETWVSRSGSGGWHFWFTLDHETTECPSGLIYGRWDTWGEDGKGKWDKHLEIRIIADNALIIAPPSVHVETGKRYRFVGCKDPNHHALPEPAPRWLLGMPRLSTPRLVEPPKPSYVPRKVDGGGRSYGRDEVLSAVGVQKLAVAREWGLVNASSGPNPNGWVSCYVPGRETPGTSSPSGSFHSRDGTLQDRRDNVTVSFFDLGVLLGRYLTWQDCRDDLGRRFIGRP